MDASEINLMLEMAEEAMKNALEHLQNELIKIRTGKASTDLLNGLLVSYYGSPTSLQQVANISTADARTIVIQPWEKSTLSAIEKSIFEAGLGLTPQNDGQVIRLNIPPLTEERRRELVKKAKQMGEDSKVGVRSSRRETMEDIKKAVKDGLSEDIGKKTEEDVQSLTNRYIERVEKMVENKEKDIMTI
jgi:ribosome recycling factor